MECRQDRDECICALLKYFLDHREEECDASQQHLLIKMIELFEVNFREDLKKPVLSLQVLARRAVLF